MHRRHRDRKVLLHPSVTRPSVASFPSLGGESGTHEHASAPAARGEVRAHALVELWGGVPGDLEERGGAVEREKGVPEGAGEREVLAVAGAGVQSQRVRGERVQEGGDDRPGLRRGGGQGSDGHAASARRGEPRGGRTDLVSGLGKVRRDGLVHLVDGRLLGRGGVEGGGVVRDRRGLRHRAARSSTRR